ncbi:protein of unknown function [Methanocaldococcus lauensis]|nr:protein of unknown function [Methanocaldococcus lauensis]CAB3287801.1 protein of unknown function [Methanocaldococcus lauensis]
MSDKQKLLLKLCFHPLGGLILDNFDNKINVCIGGFHPLGGLILDSEAGGKIRVVEKTFPSPWGSDFRHQPNQQTPIF